MYLFMGTLWLRQLLFQQDRCLAYVVAVRLMVQLALAIMCVKFKNKALKK